MLVALTGTPGTGKSSVADTLGRRGFSIIDLNSLAHGLGLFKGYDEARKCWLYDLEAISEHVAAIKVEESSDRATILEGLVSHLLPVDLIIVLRCRPSILEGRLRAKGYDKEKIRENLEAEALNILSQESHDEGEAYEIDTTYMNIEEVADSVEHIIRGDGAKYRKRLDFLEDVMSWY